MRRTMTETTESPLYDEAQPNHLHYAQMRE